jgi:hypothetical protein
MRRFPVAWLAPFVAGMSLFGWMIFTGPAAATDSKTAPLSVTPAAYLPVIFRDYVNVSDPLKRVNFYRALAGPYLPPVGENSSWSTGTNNHARYIVQCDPGTSLDFESPASPCYTSEGDDAARNSLIIGVQLTADFTDTQAVDYWARSPFQMLSILEPELLQSSYGSYREAGPGYQMAAVLDVRRGLGAIPGSVTFPLMWPGNGKTVTLRSYSGGDYPNPLSHPSCSGFNPATAGLPIILQVGNGAATISALTTSFTQGATPLPHCAFGPHDYINANSSDQNLGRALLDARDAIVLIPQNQLAQGAIYNVSVNAAVNGNANNYAWSFTVAADANP